MKAVLKKSGFLFSCFENISMRYISVCIHTISSEIFVDFKDYYEICHEVAH